MLLLLQSENVLILGLLTLSIMLLDFLIMKKYFSKIAVCGVADYKT